LSLSGKYAGNANGLFEITGFNDNGVAISSNVVSGQMNFKSAYQKRLPDVYIKINGGKLNLRISSDNAKRLVYPILKTAKMLTVKIDAARGAKGDLWQFELENSNGSEAIVQNIQPRVVTIPRRV